MGRWFLSSANVCVCVWGHPWRGIGLIQRCGRDTGPGREKDVLILMEEKQLQISLSESGLPNPTRVLPV